MECSSNPGLSPLICSGGAIFQKNNSGRFSLSPSLSRIKRIIERQKIDDTLYRRITDARFTVGNYTNFLNYWLVKFITPIYSTRLFSPDRSPVSRLNLRTKIGLINYSKEYRWEKYRNVNTHESISLFYYIAVI